MDRIPLHMFAVLFLGILGCVETSLVHCDVPVNLSGCVSRFDIDPGIIKLPFFINSTELSVFCRSKDDLLICFKGVLTRCRPDTWYFYSLQSYMTTFNLICQDELHLFFKSNIPSSPCWFIQHYLTICRSVTMSAYDSWLMQFGTVAPRCFHQYTAAIKTRNDSKIHVCEIYSDLRCCLRLTASATNSWDHAQFINQLLDARLNPAPCSQGSIVGSFSTAAHGARYQGAIIALNILLNWFQLYTR